MDNELNHHSIRAFLVRSATVAALSSTMLCALYYTFYVKLTYAVLFRCIAVCLVSFVALFIVLYVFFLFYYRCPSCKKKLSYFPFRSSVISERTFRVFKTKRTKFHFILRKLLLISSCDNCAFNGVRESLRLYGEG